MASTKVEPTVGSGDLSQKMPKSKKGGKNFRKAKKGVDEDKRELVFKEDGQEYAQVVRMLGNGRLEAFCFDGTTRLAHIRGKMRKKVWVTAGDTRALRRLPVGSHACAVGSRVRAHLPAGCSGGHWGTLMPFFKLSQWLSHRALRMQGMSSSKYHVVATVIIEPKIILPKIAFGETKNSRM